MPGLITPSLIEVLSQYVRAGLRAVFVSLPGKVLAYDANTNLADVELQVRDFAEDDDEHVLHEDFPTLIGCPVVFPRAKNALVTWDVEEGDRVAVHFCSRAIDAWIATGQKSNAGDQRVNHVAHAYVVPGLYPMTEPVATGDRQQDGLTVGIPGGLQVRVTPAEIRLGKDATDYVALASKVDAEFRSVQTTLGTIAMTPAGQPTFATPYAFGGSVAASKVKAE